MLAIVVAMFAILWLPYRAYVVYNSFARVRFTNIWYLLLCRLMVYGNSAINPVLYNAMSTKFRRSFIRLLLSSGCRRRGLQSRTADLVERRQLNAGQVGQTDGQTCVRLSTSISCHHRDAAHGPAVGSLGCLNYATMDAPSDVIYSLHQRKGQQQLQSQNRSSRICVQEKGMMRKVGATDVTWLKFRD